MKPQRNISPQSSFRPNWLFRILFILPGLFLSFAISGQKEYPKGYFRNPLDIPLNLSGNFGELRTNHFHAGIDIKTQQREGLNIYAAADGFISRIKVSPFGYGYALYIDHPNGYTTVYGHLQKYSPAIDAYVKQEQYKLQSFSIDLFPDSTMFPVKKGDFVAWSGNSGGSGGPHLHFEVRETITEKIINPLLFGFEVKDKIAPTVHGIWIKPLNDSSFVNGAQVPVTYETKVSSGRCQLAKQTPPTVYGDFGFAVHTIDMLDGNANKCGIYRVEFFVDSVQVFGQRLEKLDFATNRAMNAHTMYERFKKHKSSIHNSYRVAGNPLEIYDNLVNDGIVSFRDGKLHDCEYRITDVMGNISTLKFQVQALTAPNATPKNAKPSLAKWNFEKDNAYQSMDINLQMKAFTLYENLDLTIYKTNKIAGAITPTFQIASPYVPVHNSYDLSIRVQNPPLGKEDKMIVVRWDPERNKNVSEGGKYADGWITAKPAYLGYFAVMVDSVKPTITNVDFGADMKGRTQFSVKIADTLSGIDQIIPKIDGKWALMEYDAKNNRLTYYFDKRYIQRGKHDFELTIIDGVGNESKYTGKFEW
jgi:murein DD-endopeptidase MepM/ murein hydrolase activator NlpD